jgi:hypothetical protein
MKPPGLALSRRRGFQPEALATASILVVLQFDARFLGLAKGLPPMYSNCA